MSLTEVGIEEAEGVGVSDLGAPFSEICIACGQCADLALQAFGYCAPCWLLWNHAADRCCVETPLQCASCAEVSGVGAYGKIGTVDADSWFCVRCWFSWDGFDTIGKFPVPTSSHLQRTAEVRLRDWEKICAGVDCAEMSNGVIHATVVVFDDREANDAVFLRLGRELNARYCAARGFTDIAAGGPSWPELRSMPPHWARVAHLRTLAGKSPVNSQYFLISLDSDAAFANFAFPFEIFLSGLPHSRSIFLAKDPVMWAPPVGWEETGVYCSGLVIIRLDKKGREFLNRWSESYDLARWWQSEDGSWSTDGRWAGSAYEQGQLNVLAQGEFSDFVLELPQALFNSPRARPRGMPQPIVLHLMRRPGEWGYQEKEDRVAATFGSLLQKLDSVASLPDGIPRSSGALRIWEEDEEAWSVPPSNRTAVRRLERPSPCTGCLKSSSVGAFAGGEPYLAAGRTDGRLWYCDRCWGAWDRSPLHASPLAFGSGCSQVRDLDGPEVIECDL